jgi:hypothetical protein
MCMDIGCHLEGYKQNEGYNQGRLIPSSESQPTINLTPMPTQTSGQYDANSWKTIIPETCQKFSDGCNTCQRSDKGVRCTMMACQEYKEPKCLDE